MVKSTTGVIFFLLFSCVIGLPAAAQDAEPPTEVPYIEEASVRAQYIPDAQQALTILKAAYQLTPDETQMLRDELERYVDEAVKYDIVMRTAALEAGRAFDAEVAKRGPDWIPTEEEFKKYYAPMLEAQAKAPLTFERVQAYLESTLPAERAQAGRERVDTAGVDAAWDEYYEREDMVLQNAARNAQIRAEVEDHRRHDATLSPNGKPMPKADYVPPPVIAPPKSPDQAQPQIIARPGPAGPAPPVVPPRLEPRTQPPPEPPRPAPAPPLDEWDRRVDSIAQKYGFDAAQQTRAQAILKDLRRRAEQYRLSHAEDYERIKRTTDKKAAAEEEKRLNEPLDHLFEELTERLEQLPTGEQRAKVSAPEKPAGK